MSILLKHPDDDRLEAMASAARDLSYSYEPTGATRTSMPPGFRADHRSIDLGRGDAVFDRAVEGLIAWAPHSGAGAAVYPRAGTIEAGASILVVIRVASLTIVAPCRIVYVTSEADRYGFAYGTLDGHPEAGEEAFLIERTPHGARFAIDAFSRPAHALARIGGPVARRLQRSTTERYLQGLASFVSRS